MTGIRALNLSLLSRGIGEVQTNGHEKVEVFLEPEDYYNFVNSNRYYLPPIKSNFTFTQGSSGLSTRGSREYNEILLPKTFTTRKGALLLFSEDFALRDKERETTQKDGPAVSINTVEDLARSILSYGSQDQQENTASVYMKFLHQKREMKRQIRPGFSAKRYLATWTRNWDDNVLETVISKGYITERSLFHYNLVIPHLRRRLIAEDLSHCPAPYRLMRSMLLCPGSLSGYTFYRAVTETDDLMEDRQERVASTREKQATTIKVIKTQKDGVQREVSYASLDRTSQEEVITDLLVKSAVHYALKKQQEYMEETMKEIDEEQLEESTELCRVTTRTPVPDFNMKEAVESLLDSHRSGTSALEADFPEVDNASHSSDYGGSFRGCTIPKHEKTRHKSGSRSWTYDGSEKEYIGSAPVVKIRDGASPILTSNITHLPPLKTKAPLTPIQDVSREQTHLPLPPIADALPFVNIEAPTPQHSTLAEAPRPSPSDIPADGEDAGSEWGVSSTHSERDRGVRHVSTQWKGSQQSLKSSKKGTRSAIDDQSIKGSVVCAPDGEVVRVGGSILPDAASQYGGGQTARTDLDRGIGATDDSDISDEPDVWRSGSREDDLRGVSPQKSTSTKEASRKEHGDQASTDDGLGASFRLEHCDRSDGDDGSVLTGTDHDGFFVTPQSKSKTSFSKLKSELSTTQSTLLIFEAEEDGEKSVVGKSIQFGDSLLEKDEAHRRSSSDSRGSGRNRRLSGSARSHSEPPGTEEAVVGYPYAERASKSASVHSAWSAESGKEMHQKKSRSAHSRVSLIGSGVRKTAELGVDERIGVKDKSELVKSGSDEDHRVAEGGPGEGDLKIGEPVATADGDAAGRLDSEKVAADSKQLSQIRNRRSSGSGGGKSRSKAGSSASTKGTPMTKTPDRQATQSATSLNEALISRFATVDHAPPSELKLSPEDEKSFDQTLKSEATFNDRSSVVSGISGSISLGVSGTQILTPPLSSRHPSLDSVRSKTQLRKESTGSEQVIVDALTGHAQKIAAQILSRSEAGRDLENDIRQAAELWTKEHPPRIVSRSQSVQEIMNAEAVEEITRQRANSAAPTAQEYKDLIRQSLTTAVAKAAGKDPEAFPFDAEVSPELLEALANQSLSPDDIEIIKDDDGRNIIRSKSRILQEMGGVKEGHIYLSAASGPPSERSVKRTISIPSDRVSVADIGDYDVINYANGAPSERSRHSISSSPDDFTSALQKAEVASKKSTSGTSRVALDDTVKSGKTDASLESKQSEESKTSGDSKKSKEIKPKKKSLQDREEFVVGKVNNSKQLEKLYGPPPPPPKSEVTKKQASPVKDTEPVAVIQKEEVKEDYAPDVEMETPKPAEIPAEPIEAEKPQKDENRVKSQAKAIRRESIPAKKTKSVSSEPESEPDSVQQPPEKKPAPPKPAAKVDVQPPLKRTEVQVPTKPRPPPPVPAAPVPQPRKVDDKLDTKLLIPAHSSVSGKPKKGKPRPPKPKKEPAPPKKEEKKKGGKKKGKKVKKEEPVVAPKPATPPPKPPTPQPSPPKVPTPPKSESPEQYVSPVSSPERSDDDMEFIIIRDESPSPEPIILEKTSPVREMSPRSEPPSEPQSEDEDTALKSISSKEARAAKRAAAANKRREEVERRRKEREEQLKREKEEQERQERLRREMEEERRRLEEERRLRRQRQTEEKEQEEEAERERERKQQLELEREKRQKEEYARKLEEMKRRQAEEELKRMEIQRLKDLEEEERRKEEELRMSLMAEQERLEYEKRKKEEEELRLIKEEEDRKRREEEAQRALEEARRLAEDMARRQAELEQRLKFNRDLQMEAGGLEHTQDITRMFVFSYFELLQWLGLDIPEFELQKLNNL